MASCSRRISVKQSGAGPTAVCRRQDRLVREGAGAAFPQGGKHLFQPAVAEVAEYKQCVRKFPAFIFPFCRRNVTDSGKNAPEADCSPPSERASGGCGVEKSAISIFRRRSFSGALNNNTVSFMVYDSPVLIYSVSIVIQMKRKGKDIYRNILII